MGRIGKSAVARTESNQSALNERERIRHEYISYIRAPAKLKNMFFCSSVKNKTFTN